MSTQHELKVALFLRALEQMSTDITRKDNPIWKDRYTGFRRSRSHTKRAAFIIHVERHAKAHQGAQWCKELMTVIVTLKLKGSSK